jgi:hypothetical protein
MNKRGKERRKTYSWALETDQTQVNLPLVRFATRIIFGSILGAFAVFDEEGNFGHAPKSTKFSNTSTSFTPNWPWPTFAANKSISM